MRNIRRVVSSTEARILIICALVVSGCKINKTTNSSTREVPYKQQNGEKVFKSGYALNPSDTNCGGFPTLRIETMPGTCVGLVKQSDDTKFHPRVIVEIPGKKNEFLISDFANWDTTQGKIWYLKSTGNFATTVMTPVLTGLSVPHQLTAGPENHIFFAEDGRIRAFPISAINGTQAIPASAVVDVVTNLPAMISNGQKNSMHPLKHFAFDSQFNMYINIGAYTDHCSDFKGKECLEADIKFGTAGSTDIREQGAVIRKYKFNGSLAKKWDSNYTIVARGLRNSMGLLFTPSGDLIQVENGRDFNESTRPFEELNVIRKADLEGRGSVPHFGWPYCYDYSSTSEEWAKFSFICDPARNPEYRSPYVFLPPHSSPLGIVQYTGNMFPNLKNKLLVSLHGYRSAGHRIIAFKTDATGLPVRLGKGAYRDDDNSGGTTAFIRPYPEVPAATESEEVIHGWYDAPGFRPRGAPVAIAQASDGSLWIADDKSHAILRLATPVREVASQGPAPRPNFAKAYTQIIAETPEFRKSYDALVKKVIVSAQCEGCHDNYTNTGDATGDGLHHLRYILAMGNWVIPGELENSTLYTKMNPPGKSAMPPIDKPYPSIQAATEALDTVKAFVMAMPKRENIWKVKAGSKPVVKGLKRGQPGNSVCATLAPETYVLAVNNNPATLGGQKMLEIVIGKPSSLVKETACANYDAFYVAQENLEKLLVQ